MILLFIRCIFLRRKGLKRSNHLSKNALKKKNQNYISILRIYKSSLSYLLSNGHTQCLQEHSVFELVRKLLINIEKYGIYGLAKISMYSLE